MSKPYLFSPSEFAFGYSGCKRCYYDLKVNDVRINFGFPLDTQVAKDVTTI